MCSRLLRAVRKQQQNGVLVYDSLSNKIIIQFAQSFGMSTLFPASEIYIE